MSIQFLTNLPPVGESVAKLSSEGGQLVADFVSMYGFFAFCLALVLCCLLLPPYVYEKYYKIADGDPVEETHVDQRKSTDPAA